MFDENFDHYRIVKEALRGQREKDEQTLSSLNVLNERLQRLKKLNRVFNNVDFSAAVKKLVSEKDTMMVC